MFARSIFLLPNGTFFVELLVVVAIRAALEPAETARAEAAAAGDERAVVLAQARDQAREIVAAAQALADQVKAEAGGRGQAEYERIVASADGEINTARQRAIDEESARIGEIVFDLVTKIVGREVDQSAHQDLVQEAVAALNAEAAKGSNR